MLEVSDGPRFGIETHTMVYLVLDAPFVPRNAQIRTLRACRQLSPGYNESSLKLQPLTHLKNHQSILVI